MAEPKHESGVPLWGVSAEFDTAEATLAAILVLRDHDFGRLDAFSPVPIAGAADAMGLPSRTIYPASFISGFVGALAMFGMCTYATVFAYRFDIGGRPLFSWPSFIVPSASFGALTGALVAVAVAMVLSRLPRLNHPAFNIPRFTRVTRDGFFVAIESRDDRFDPAQVEAALAGLITQPRRINRVPR